MIRNNQNRRRRGGNGPRPQQMTGGNNYGNRLDNRQRGNASQLLEKYRSLARDATQAGDRVTAEYYAQYAEHYYRLLGDHRDRNGEPLRRPRDDDDGYEGSAAEEMADGEEGDAGPRREEERSWRNERNRRDEQRRDEPRREDSRREDSRRDEPRWEDSRRDEPRRDDRRRDERRDWNRDRDARRRDAPRAAADDAETRAETEVFEGPIPGLPGPATLSLRPVEAEMLPPAEPAFETHAGEPETTAEEAPAPRRRGRPRKVVA